MFFTKEHLKSTFCIKVSANSKKSYVKVIHNEDGSFLLKVFVKEVPENGKANMAVIKLLAKEIGIPQSNLDIISGHKNKNKIISIKN